MKQVCIPVGCVPPTGHRLSSGSGGASMLRGGGGVHRGGIRGIHPEGVHPGGSWGCIHAAVNRMTHACENITLPCTSYLGGNYHPVLRSVYM